MNVAFISQSEEFDTSTPMGRAMMHIATVFAQLERETTALRIRDNMLELSKTGRWLGGTTPTGYKSVGEELITIDGKKRKLYKLGIIPEEADTIDVYKRQACNIAGLFPKAADGKRRASTPSEVQRRRRHGGTRKADRAQFEACGSHNKKILFQPARPG